MHASLPPSVTRALKQQEVHARRRQIGDTPSEYQLWQEQVELALEMVEQIIQRFRAQVAPARDPEARNDKPGPLSVAHKAAAGGPTLGEAVERMVLEHFATGREGEGRGRHMGYPIRDFHGPDKLLTEITTRDIRAYVAHCHERGNRPATINVKLAFYSAMFTFFEPELPLGFQRPKIPWAKKRRPIKWYAPPDLAATIIKWFSERGYLDVADYVEFVTHTGCRVEEALRLQRHHFDFTRDIITIPGTKTEDSFRTVPLFSTAKEIAERRLMGAKPNDHLFMFLPKSSKDQTEAAYIERQYRYLARKWSAMARALKLYVNKTATLKALRRTFAVYATRNGMPTEMLRRYMGHDNIETTQGYLNVFGKEDTDVLRQWVS